MIGLIVIIVTALLLIAYLCLLRITVRYAKRKTGSNFVAALAVVGLLVVTFGDTLFNRWYHKEVLCKREDVGLKIFERVKLPPEFIDEKTQQPNLPFLLTSNVFFEHFTQEESRINAGLFPLTAYGRIERKILNLESGKVLAKFVDYWPSGGPWWAFPLKWFDETTIIGWLNSRQQTPTCFDGPEQFSLLGVTEYFYLINNGTIK